MQIQLKELRGHPILKSLTHMLMESSIQLFLTSMESSESETYVSYSGSGTLVTYKGFKGILTASHVIACLYNRKPKKEELIWLPILPRENKTNIMGLKLVHFTKAWSIDLWDSFLAEKWPEESLDITLLELAAEDFGNIIKTGKKAIDLGVYREKYESKLLTYLRFNTNNAHMLEQKENHASGYGL